MDRDRLLNELLPYRMQAIETLNLALDLSARSGAAPMTIHAADKLVIEGTLHAFTNPAIEAGLMHGRTLPEFLGLIEKNGKLRNRKSRQPDDIGIDHFETPAGVRLKMVTPYDVASRYPGPSEQAEAALLAALQVTNKGLAHVTEVLKDSPEHARFIEIASRGIPVLMVGCFYKPMGLPAPDYKLTHRPRNG